MNYFAMQNEESYFCIWYMNENKHIFKKAKELSKMDFSNKENVFFTPNSLGFRRINGINKIWRDRNYLQSFESLYCDIDLEADQEPEEVYKYIKNHVIGVELPTPTMVICSGNGLHIYWNIESVSYRGNIEKWQQSQEYIYSCLRMVGADKSVTDDFVRVLRVPGTVNNKAGQSKKCYVIESNDTKYSLNQFIKDYVIEENTKQNKAKIERKIKREDNVYSFYNELFKKRLNDLEMLLLNHRDKAGSRENILFLYRYYCMELYKNEQKALDLTIALNDRLKNPISEKELKKATKSAEKYHFDKKLKWTNEKLIEWLEITEEEQKSLSVLCGVSVRKDRKAKRNKADYQKRLNRAHKRTKSEMIFDRQCKIYELLQKGRNKEQICMKLHISERTYYSDLKAIKNDVFVGAFNKAIQILEVAKTGTDRNTVNTAENTYCRKFSTLNYYTSAEHCLIENTPFYHYIPPHPHI